ncbi:HPr kinase/phosphorylase [Luteitalea sp. TBR-22]|uniref:HPr(Ser) kinase/phosphatase n=1 Tax=Luteitalea sp. TBR-22 TaxID=2802971 RepID=UPI001AF0B398|nr:HPr(Ser) kinase/phosphatase [Luteitalea sp. TBR-22]BCS33390.1 HPr kinase/phosphorylase [Luteitalea sp. TBR-22]
MVAIPESGPQSLTVRDLLARCAGTPLGDLSVRAGASGLARRITRVSLQKTGLALTGQPQYLEDGRVLLFGRSEVQYLASLDDDVRRRRLRDVLRPGLPCIVVTAGLPVDAVLIAEADARGVPVLSTDVLTSETLVALTGVLEEGLAPVTTLHGVLVDILGLGVLLLGESGIGKSECALDLVVRGHRLVADDAVEITRRGSALIGTSPPLTRHHMEVRGLGIMNVQDLFGVASTRHSMQVEFIVRLVRWDSHTEYERLGLDEATEPLLGVPVPVVTLPVGPGRNIGILVEVAARRHLLLARGISAAQRLAARLEAELQAGES